ncbi:hypothetical protein ACOC6V_000294 [Listeria monocytogenes]|uniref:Uncharacterized protein n=3 Tax=Listeria monocytogenes TaxID=1639 RepID=A0A0B8R6T9_LISMN|nr:MULTISPECIES: hypothetical protein [Listeria]EAD5050102.1 hypothetical protein [Listeria monocytogenes serotype 4b]EAF3077109.1 hypothetical protein [Listeria monocytogenes serotype 1/2a]EAG6252044.1 hypothetical protein [Listeria monocytogenes CFSAN003806]EAG6261393.1 hypothetical protein [Listeria monocytogenes CFSAN003725]EAG6331092.1 hypothetical protein [Listeria monocytogenes CFSAN002346]EAG6350948.1 hypothetical protein [Listeria monocytogenes LIS0102]EAG6364051.1 hypothetical prot
MKKIMKKDDYSKMPWVSAEDLYLLFEQALKDFKQSKLSKKEFFDILDELTMRQVDTYEILKEPLRGQLDNELYNLWNTENYDDVDIITSLLINLGLKNTYNKMKKSIEDTSEISPEILEEIQDAIEEVGDNIDDPYQDYMKKM